MQAPLGVATTRPTQVCKLLKSLCGLKQASRQWFAKLSNLLVQCGYIQSISDHSLFIKSTGNSITVILVYVDDIVLAGDSLGEFNDIKHVLDSNFRIKDLGVLKYFLGLEVAHSKMGIFVCQRRYCLDLLKESGLLGSKSVHSPLDCSVRLTQDVASSVPDPASYRWLVVRLLYLNSIRPDVCFATQ